MCVRACDIFTHSSTDQHLGCSHTLAIASDAAVNAGAQTPGGAPVSPPLHSCPGERSLGCTAVLFSLGPSSRFHSGCTDFAFPPECAGVPFPYIFAKTSRTFDCRHSNRCNVKSPRRVATMCYFGPPGGSKRCFALLLLGPVLAERDGDDLFKRLFAICPASLLAGLVQRFAASCKASTIITV